MKYGRCLIFHHLLSISVVYLIFLQLSLAFRTDFTRLMQFFPTLFIAFSFFFSVAQLNASFQQNKGERQKTDNKLIS